MELVSRYEQVLGGWRGRSRNRLIRKTVATGTALNSGSCGQELRDRKARDGWSRGKPQPLGVLAASLKVQASPSLSRAYGEVSGDRQWGQELEERTQPPGSHLGKDLQVVLD